MKFDTLILRYKNLGYTPKDLPNELEVDNLIQWVYDKYNIFVTVHYCTMRFPGAYQKFTGHRLWNIGTDYCTSNFTKKNHKHPYDAKFDALRELYSEVRFNFH